jgi:hypothetical protein
VVIFGFKYVLFNYQRMQFTLVKTWMFNDLLILILSKPEIRKIQLIELAALAESDRLILEREKEEV